nr:hypothetical protein Iba_chr12aCG14650 [Ipomoea batatas]
MYLTSGLNLYSDDGNYRLVNTITFRSALLSRRSPGYVPLSSLSKRYCLSPSLLRTQESSVTLSPDSPVCLCPRTDGTVAPLELPPNTEHRRSVAAHGSAGDLIFGPADNCFV